MKKNLFLLSILCVLLMFSCSNPAAEMEVTALEEAVEAAPAVQEESSKGSYKLTSLYAKYEKNPSGNSSDRKVELRIYITNGYVYMKVENFKRHWIGSSWNTYSTECEMQLFDLQIQTSSGSISTFSGSLLPTTCVSYTKYLGYVGSGSFIKRAYARATNRGVGAYYAVIDYTYTPPDPCANVYSEGYSDGQADAAIGRGPYGANYDYSINCGEYSNGYWAGFTTYANANNGY